VKTFKNTILKISFAMGAMMTYPQDVWAASTLQGAAQDTTKLITQIGQWFLGIFMAAAVVFIIRAAFKMHAADDDGEYSRGRKMLVRSIIGVIIAGLAEAIVTTVRTAYGF
jgi:hypothetical protein